MEHSSESRLLWKLYKQSRLVGCVLFKNKIQGQLDLRLVALHIMMVFKFEIASNVTATFTAGNWYYQAVANKSGAEKQTIYTGSFEVLKSFRIFWYCS